jgi:hypothetical protein
MALRIMPSVKEIENYAEAREVAIKLAQFLEKFGRLIGIPDAVSSHPEKTPERTAAKATEIKTQQVIPTRWVPSPLQGQILEILDSGRPMHMTEIVAEFVNRKFNPDLSSADAYSVVYSCVSNMKKKGHLDQLPEGYTKRTLQAANTAA